MSTVLLLNSGADLIDAEDFIETVGPDILYLPEFQLDYTTVYHLDIPFTVLHTDTQTTIIDPNIEEYMASLISRKSAELGLEIEKGSTFRHTLTWKSGTAGAETPVDLTGATARMQLRQSVTAATFDYEMTTENSGITLGSPDPIDGTITLYMSDSDTTGFAWTKAVYSLEIQLANGDVRTIVRGNVTAYDETTR